MSASRSAATTIAAISSPPGAGARGVIRVSGPRARELVLATWSGTPHPPSLAQRGLHFGRFRDERGEQPLLLLWMPAPHSFTREDVAEMHLPGAPPLLASALRRLIALGAVPAPPGEFTRRAFLSGRIDLTRAEGVLALVLAHDDAERQAGTALLFGGLGERVGAVRAALEDLRAICEASLDFDENDTGHVPRSELEARCLEIAARVQRALHFERDRLPRANGLARVALFGARNAGKSALFNALAGADRALVSDFAGTTRDGLECAVDLGASACLLRDAAGLDPGALGPDRRAQDSARAARDSADLVLWVVDASRADASDAAGERRSLPAGVPRLLVWSKIDLVSRAPVPSPEARSAVSAEVATSALRGGGLDELRARIAQEISGGPHRAGATRGVARELFARHVAALEQCSRELDLGLARARGGAPLELLAEHLRAATSALDDITGETTPEDVLDRLFARFCLGK
jgi:tRNA modification GTPase